jgi:hypothetical protein
MPDAEIGQRTRSEGRAGRDRITEDGCPHNLVTGHETNLLIDSAYQKRSAQEGTGYDFLYPR